MVFFPSSKDKEVRLGCWIRDYGQSSAYIIDRFIYVNVNWFGAAPLVPAGLLMRSTVHFKSQTVLSLTAFISTKVERCLRVIFLLKAITLQLI